MKGDKLVIETAPVFLAEKEYGFHVLLHELLGLEYRLQVSPAAQHYRLHLPGGAVLVVEDHFWGRFPEEKYLDADNVPDRAETVPSPFDGSLLSIIFGRNHFETGNETGTTTAALSTNISWFRHAPTPLSYRQKLFVVTLYSTVDGSDFP